MDAAVMQITSRWPGTPELESESVTADWIFEDPLSKALLADIEQVAPSDASVLISGKTGTGKEMIARYLHNRSLRRHGPFVTVSCGAFSEALIDAELFGYENGAFAGAFGVETGRLEEANQGTLFLDEINDLPILVQAKLLRALKNREVVRLGGHKGIPVDVRVLASTTADLEELMAAGKFRPDLYYRLNVVNLEIQTLSERPGDIVPLARYFIREYSRQLNYPGASLAPDAERALIEYPWRGNVRELENVIHRTLLMCDGGRIEATSLRFPGRYASLNSELSRAPEPGITPDKRPAQAAAPNSGAEALRQSVRLLCNEHLRDLYQFIEETVFSEVFHHCHHSQSEAARLLGVSRNVVRARLMRSGDLREPRRSAQDASLKEVS
jgi:DNA-binding NtrC family response regulator